jgi:hypothetical protein
MSTMESLKIVVLCVLAAILYGVIHDQFTARICIEYFTIFHPPVFKTHSPTLLALGWGVVATWWVGAFLGVLLAIASRGGQRPLISADTLIPRIAVLLAIMAVCAVISGFVGYFWGGIPEYVASLLPPNQHRRFVADWWAHNASYASGIVGGIILCGVVYKKRKDLSRQVEKTARA